MSKPTAAEHYETLREEIDSLLGDIEAALDEHRPSSPDLIRWGHVGDLESYAGQLRELADQLCRRGEYGEGS